MVVTLRCRHSWRFTMDPALIPPLLVIFVFAVFAAPSAWLARRRGRSAVIWGGLGVLFPVLSIVALALLGESKQASSY